MLTEKAIDSAKARDKQYKLFDSRVPGLALVVHPSGAKYWWLEYRFGGRRRTVTVGVPWPRTGLAMARERALELRKILDSGRDPGAEKRQQKQAARVESARTFEVAANNWFDYRGPAWSQATKNQVREYLDKDLIPALGRYPLSTIKTIELAELIERIEDRGAPDVAVKTRGWIRSIFQFARAKGLTDNGPERDLAGLSVRVTPRNYPHLDLDGLPGLIRKLDAAHTSVLVKTATWMALWTANRPGVTRTLRWDELDLENALWTIERGREGMTRGYSHLTPLPAQAVGALRLLKSVTGSFDYVFTNRNDPLRPMSDGAVNRLLGTLGYRGRQTAHGFRHLISTALNELGYEADWVERQLAHGDPDKIRGTYNKAVYLEPRRKMMQDWADYLDKLRVVGAPSSHSGLDPAGKL